MRAGAAGVAAVVVLLAAATGGVWAQEEGLTEKCTDKGQCRDCIQMAGCVWCIKPKVESMKKCQDNTSIDMTSFCDPADLQNPENEVEVVNDEALTEKDKSDRRNQQPQEIVQLRPQRVKLRLRKGVPQDLTVTFRRARAYPVDLYYLMDLSNSMKDDKENLAKLSQTLSATLSNLTDQYAVGFGSFVDKVMMPFTDTSAKKLANPCDNCSSPYSFRNDMKLTKDPELFKTRVEQAQISGNLDSPEGGFDALMQAMVCEEQIGWRENVRRIIIFSTDDKFHVAGEGRLAGVVTPNDEQCHLNEHGEYTAYDQFDYPSIGQINKVAKERNINVIFAVLGHPKLYETLSKRIESSTMGLLEEGSSNVVDLIKEQYESISSEVRLTDNSTEDVTIEYSSKCKGDVVNKTDTCTGIQENDEVTFTLQITANECPADGKGSTVFVKAGVDTLTLDLEFHCSCDCPESNDTTTCQNGGRLVCGVCDCLEGYNGDRCQCADDGSSYGLSDDQNKRCLANEDATRPCSGLGVCKCGECKCNEETVSGKFCECNSRNCIMGTTGDVCDGHGVCDCNTCKCEPGFAGKYCQCKDDTACMQPGTDKVCSGHGTCECGKCKCSSQLNDTYTGMYCEDCLRCGEGKCNRFRECVECVHFGNGPLQPDCSSCDTYQTVESLDEQMFKGARLCTFQDEDGCFFNFTYHYPARQNKEEVFVQQERRCQEPVNILSIVFALIGAIVGVGILTLIIWKIVTTFHDRREYQKFMEETRNARFTNEENPLYRSATTTTQNPAFASQGGY